MSLFFKIIVALLICIYILMWIVAKCTKSRSIDDLNPYIHTEKAELILPQEMAEYAKNLEVHNRGAIGIYTKLWKRVIDSLMSFFGLIILSPLYLIIFIAIKIEDPGPALFKQKRVGIDKRFFYLHKFRSMKMSTPHDIPTHMLQNPEQYITKVGEFLRKSSMDELPQLWDIFRGEMSIIGPRPALWNQADLVAEREKYDANAVKPGLTGLAQINGRDELEIPIKARFDGEYAKAIKDGGVRAFSIDMKCFFATIFKVLKGEGIVEGGETQSQRQLWDEIHGEDEYQILK